MGSTDTDSSVIKEGEYHPSADMAMAWFKEWQIRQGIGGYALVREAIASTALSGNRLAEILNGTLDRLEQGKPVSDRYLLGLCWYLKYMEEKK